MPDRTVNPRYISQQVTVAANTAIASPSTTVTALGHCTLESVQVFIPHGHSGLTGIAVQLAGVHLVPYDDPNAYILGDNTQDTFEVGVEIDTGLVIRAYNTDAAFAHTFYLRWKVRDLVGATTGPDTTIVPIASAPSFGTG